MKNPFRRRHFWLASETVKGTPSGVDWVCQKCGAYAQSVVDEWQDGAVMRQVWRRPPTKGCPGPVLVEEESK